MRENVFRAEGKWAHKIKVLLEGGRIMQDTKTGFDSEDEAERSYLLYKKDFKKKYHTYLQEHEVNTEIMFDDYLQYWFDTTFSERVESTTRVTKSYALNNLLLPNIKTNIKLKYVTTEYLDALIEEASKVSESSGNAARELLCIALKDAVIEGYILENPAQGTKTYRTKKPSIKVLNKKQVKILLKAASKNSWYLEILLCLFCGLRKGEVAGLKFSDFDMEAHTVRISRQLGVHYEFDEINQKKISHLVEKPPKTQNSYRVLRVPEVIIKELKKRQALVEYNKMLNEGEYEDNDYISCQQDGKPHRPSSMNIAVTKLCKKNALPSISVHSLRHMYATILMEQGVQLPKISALLGHESINTTFEYYCEIMDENEKIIDFMNHIIK